MSNSYQKEYTVEQAVHEVQEYIYKLKNIKVNIILNTSSRSTYQRELHLLFLALGVALRNK